MRPDRILTIARKELSETIRDRRTILLMVFLPLILYPLLIVGLSRLQDAQSDAAEARPALIAVWGLLPDRLAVALDRQDTLHLAAWKAAPAEIRKGLEDGWIDRPPAAARADPAPSMSTRQRRVDALRLELTEPENPVLAAARHAVLRREADAVLVVWPGAPSALREGRQAAISIYFDSVRESSVSAERRLRDALETFRDAEVVRRQLERGLPPGFASAVELRRRDVAPPARQAGRVLGTFLPFLLLSLSLVSGFYSAVDLTAGEKERGTMQTLLCAPISSHEIVIGKFLAVWAIGLIASLMNVVSLGLTTARLLPGGLQVPVSAYALAALMIVPVSMATTALFLAVAAFARDFKDGQNLLTPLYLLLILPAAASMIPSIELNPWTSFVPLVNIALLIKALFTGEARSELMFLTLVASIAYATMALLFAVRVFGREQILLGGRESTRALFGLERRRGGIPSPAVALVAFALALVVAFYGSLTLESRGITTMLLVTQIGFFLAPALAVVLGLGFSARDTFRLRRPPWHGAAAGILLGASAWILVGGIVMRLAPPPDSLVKALERLLRLGEEPVPLWAVWLVIAVVPAVCEELFFRGLVMSGLRALGTWPAIVGSALLFGLAHASIYRLLPTVVLGLILGYAVWKSGSIFTGMIVHALNNGLIATVTQVRDRFAWLGANDTTLGWGITAGGCLLTAAGLVLLSRVPAEEDRRE